MTSSPENFKEYAIALHAPADACSDPEVRREWDELLAQSSSAYIMYQSPEWLEATGGEGPPGRYQVAVVRGESGEILCIVPLESGTQKVTIGFRGLSRQLNVQTMDVLGSQILARNDDAFREAVRALLRGRERRALYFKSIRVDSREWRHFRETGWLGRGRDCVWVARDRRFDSVKIEGTFSDYLHLFKRKERYNLKRQVRIMEERANGDLKLVRIERDEDVGTLQSASMVVHSGSWKKEEDRHPFLTEAGGRALAGLAGRGLLRSYVMYMGERAVAFVLGFQYRGVFHYSDVAYHEEFAGLSPGSVLLFLLLEDLFEHRRPSILHFGIGEADYKRRFANFKEYDNEVLLMKRGLMATCFRMNAFMRAKGKNVRENLRRDMEEPLTNEADESSREPSPLRRQT